MTTEQFDHLTPQQLASRWHKAAGTLANWRSAHKGPSYIKVGKDVLYPLTAVVEFERQNTVA